MKPSQDELKASLEVLIRRAEVEGKWLYCLPHRLWLSPQEMRKYIGEGRYVWHISNWELRDPLAHLCSEMIKMQAMLDTLYTFAHRLESGYKADVRLKMEGMPPTKQED